MSVQIIETEFGLRVNSTSVFIADGVVTCETELSSAEAAALEQYLKCTGKKTEKKVMFLTTRCGHELVPKNKLEDCFNKYLKSISNKMFDYEELEQVKLEIIKVAQSLNETYNRCKPIKPSFSERNERYIAIEGYYAISFYIDISSKASIQDLSTEKFS